MSVRRIGVVAGPWDTFEVEENRTTDGDTASMTKVGLYTALRAMRPAVGDTLDGWNGYIVDSCPLSKRPGGMGKLTINMHLEEASGGGGAFGFISRKLSLTWRQEDGGLWSGFASELGSAMVIANIRAWQAEPDATLKAAYKYKNQSLLGANGVHTIQFDTVELSAPEKMIAKRLDCNQSGHMLFLPVVTVSERYSKEPKVTCPWRIVTAATLKAAYAPPKQHKVIPTEYAASVPYKYMLTRSDAQQDDRGWTVTKEWIGSIPPGGKLEEAWGVGNAFDPLYYGAEVMNNGVGTGVYACTISTSINAPGCV